MSARRVLWRYESSLRAQHGDEVLDEFLHPPTPEEREARRVRDNMNAAALLGGEVG